MNYYSIKIKKVRKKIVYYLLLFLIIFNSIFYLFIAYDDFIYSNRIDYSYKNILNPRTKKILSKGFNNISIKDFIVNIIDKEYNVYYIYPLFIEFLNKKNIKKEIKYDLIIYSINFFEKIKKSSLLLDFKSYIYTYWNYPKNDVIKIIRESLKIDNNLLNHKILFNKDMINKYSLSIIKFYKAKTLLDSSAYFNYLIRTKNYKEIVKYINSNKINIDIRTLDKSMAENIIKIGDFQKSKKIILDLIKKKKIDYLYYYLSLLYKNNNMLDKSIEALEKIKTVIGYDKYYMVYLSEAYFRKKEYKKAIRNLLNTNNHILKTYCSWYVRYTNLLPILERQQYFERVKYICRKKYIYKILTNYYKRVGNIEKYDFYNIELNNSK